MVYMHRLQRTTRRERRWYSRLITLALSLGVATSMSVHGQGDDRLVGTWELDEGFQITRLLFRSSGRYQLETRSTDPVFDFASIERGFYSAATRSLVLTPYDHLGEPQGREFELDLAGATLSLTRTDFPYTQSYLYVTGSREDVLAQEQAPADLVSSWTRHIEFYGDTEFTFRPGGYYVLKSTPEGGQFPPEYVRGRYEQQGRQVTLTPYSGSPVGYEADFFGNTLTLIKSDQFGGESAAYEQVPGSGAVVRAKAAEAEAFLGREGWQVGVWEVRDPIHTVDLTIRPDGHYVAREETEFLEGIVRGRYALETRRIHLQPFVGQGLYARSNGEFGMVARTRELDYFDGELQFIDLDAISQSVTLARKRSGSEAEVLAKLKQAQQEREQDGWQLGIWEVQDPKGWMQFTFRPDHRYIAKSGANGIPDKVERGQYRFAMEKVTLAPYAGLGAARGFELDYYDGDLFLVGDLHRMVVGRKVPGSEAGVAERTLEPSALRGERGGILGRWTANLPGQFAELVFRHDGQFRLTRCLNGALAHDYGLYAADAEGRALVSDSRFLPIQTHGLDFYGETMTIHGGSLGPPRTYVVNLGVVDAAIEASFAADAAEAEVDQQWLARISVGPRDPDAVQLPGGGIPADPNPGRIFPSPTVLQNYQLYRRLIFGLVYFNHLGSITSVPVVNTREWHFFPTGRLLVRFRNYSAGVVFPDTVETVTDAWGAYRVDPKPEAPDILHLYADNGLFVDMDSGEQVEMTLEDGRRHLFWGKDYMIQSDWAKEGKPIPCVLPPNPDPNLLNTGLELSTRIEPDDVGAGLPLVVQLAVTTTGEYRLSGTVDRDVDLVVESTASLEAPFSWVPVQTNHVTAGPFSLPVNRGTGSAAFFRGRLPW